MFHDVQFADWSAFVAIFAFAASVGIFLFFLVGALRTPASRLARDASLPFQDEKRS